MLLWIAIALGLGCALSICVRSGPVSARAANVLALLAVAAAAIVPPIAERVLRSAHVAIVTTGEASAELRAQSDQLRSGFLPMPDVAFVQSTGDLDAAIARAALAAGPRLMDTLVVWNAPFAPSAHAPQSPLAGASALVAAPLAFSPDSLRMEFASAPREARPLAAEVRVASTDALRADLAVAGDGWDAKASVGLGAGSLGPIAALPTKAGSAQVEVAVDSGGRRVSWNGAFEVLAAPVALWIAPPGPLAAALRAQGVKTEEADALPEDLSRYCAVVLGSALPAAAQQRLQRAIDDGIGVFAFGDGLQRDGDPLRDALPIRVLPRNEGNAGDGGEGDGPAMPTPANPNAPKQPDKDPPQPEKPNEDLRAEDPIVSPKEPMEVDKHTIAMVLVIDRSGSMGLRVAGGETKMSYAKTSARETARALGEGDEVGLVTFGDDDLARVEMALTDAAQFARIEQGIARLAHANERTFLDSGLLLARAMLGKSKASVRHVVVLSDGEVWDQELVLRQRANAMRKEGLTLSMISIVDDRTLATFQKMAERVVNQGGGLFLCVRDVKTVPQVVSAEVARILNHVGREPIGNPAETPAPTADAAPAGATKERWEFNETTSLEQVFDAKTIGDVTWPAEISAEQRTEVRSLVEDVCSGGRAGIAAKPKLEHLGFSAIFGLIERLRQLDYKSGDDQMTAWELNKFLESILVSVNAGFAAVEAGSDIDPRKADHNARTNQAWDRLLTRWASKEEFDSWRREQLAEKSRK